MAAYVYKGEDNYRTAGGCTKNEKRYPPDRRPRIYRKDLRKKLYSRLNECVRYFFLSRHRRHG